MNKSSGYSMRVIMVSLVCVLTFAVRPAFSAGPWYVGTNSPSDGPGTSWDTAFHTIQQGVDAAASGETVYATNGTYYLTDTVTVGSGITVTSVNGRDVTIIDGQYPSYMNRCLYLNSGAAVEGFTIRNGYADADVGGGVYMAMGADCKLVSCTVVSNTAYSRGGGIYCRLGTMITNCIVRNNITTYAASATTDAGGGGVYMSNGGSLLNSVIENNTSGYYGGGVVTFGADTFVNNCIIRGNISVTGGGLRFYCDNHGGLVQNCTITNNISNFGGGISHYGLNVMGGVVSNTVVSFNTAVYDGGGVHYANRGGTGIGLTICDNVCSNEGGGVFMSGTGQLFDSVISENRNYDQTYGAHELRGGGGIYIYNGGVVSNCAVVGNMVSRKAAGIFIRYSGTVMNCVISNNYNVAGYIGGVYMQQNGVLQNCLIAQNDVPFGSSGGVNMQNNSGNHLENCTITRNSCGNGNGGGISYSGGSVTNCIIYSNYASGSGDDVYSSVGYANFGYSCAPELSGGTGNITSDPLFIESGSGYGTNAISGNYRLALGSPCINKGFLLGWMIDGATDLDGKDRISPSHSGVVDMGCYETTVVIGTIIIIQ